MLVCSRRRDRREGPLAQLLLHIRLVHLKKAGCPIELFSTKELSFDSNSDVGVHQYAEICLNTLRNLSVHLSLVLLI